MTGNGSKGETIGGGEGRTVEKRREEKRRQRKSEKKKITTKSARDACTSGKWMSDPGNAMTQVHARDEHGHASSCRSSGAGEAVLRAGLLPDGSGHCSKRLQPWRRAGQGGPSWGRCRADGFRERHWAAPCTSPVVPPRLWTPHVISVTALEGRLLAVLGPVTPCLAPSTTHP